ncbi:Eukaryotic translation initiation factor 4E type 2 [Fulvia fulva]|uniref:Eukaryotic translation initiation factor 4E type 2 n=1 Tax=Passalora fulva TaxID=5499 RepID=A0A9Q8PA42_PASFU|nr:Eukaryotic translation initiation factor 4E type 2 [Fulvia fulva]KAK4622057.1 Eukaryotic translation initiation factor 4E type 2 [Fulvia fulva]KAK4623392.1 Eukaryotic translation initiation factor 4E type 2 [Fulvia fulva]UJO18695.1 Eukaryotic translation initiation factor 4E type 2 [Fulvia fulva]WPV16551.1 Eukaryotic translation initiation factor 4E type 2 [Fulvia fulva]WPV31235.1 Eukaryotic translation initiation factor 4E type 2 [Fulvia fulva]
MGSNNDNSPSNLWTRRSNSSKLSLSVNKNDRNDTRDSHDTPSTKRFGSSSSHGKNNPFNSIGPISTSSVASPTGTGASSAFGLGSGAFASFGATGKTPKTPGGSFDLTKSLDKRDSSEDNAKDSRRPPARKSLSNFGIEKGAAEPPASSSKETAVLHPLKDNWIIYYRKPTSKNSDYEKSITPMCRIGTVEDFWKVYVHLTRPSGLPTVSDYHFFKEGIRPVWEDEENKKGGKWTMRLKKGVADRYWEDLLMAMVGDQFAEAGEEVCGAVVSVRIQEDVFSIWTKNDGGRNIKIRETIKRVLSLPPDTNLQWRSHDESITQRIEVDKARQEKANQDKNRRNTLVGDKKKDEE